MPLYIADYMTDAGHLPTIAHGAYMLLLFNYWQRQGPIPADDFTLQGITKLSDSEWERYRPHIARFFRETDGHWHHKRVDEEIEKAREKIELARNKGKASAQQRLNRSSTPAEQQLNTGSTIEAKGKGKDSALINSDELIGGTSEPPPVLDDGEIERRLEQATGWQGLRNVGAISKLIASGVSFDDRILPLARTVSREFRECGKPPPKVWGYLVEVVNDQTRKPSSGSIEVEHVFVPEGSGYWAALVRSGKSESYLRSIKKRSGHIEGVWWAKRDLPPLESRP